MPPKLWLPPQVDDRPHFHCRLCGAHFAKRHLAYYERHVARCGRQHNTELLENGPHQRNPAWYGKGDQVDTEWEQHVRTRARINPDGTWTA